MPTVDIGKDGFLILTDDAKPISLDTGFGAGGHRNGFPASREVRAISPPDRFPVDRGPRTPLLSFLGLFRCTLSLEPLSFFRN